MSKKTLKNPKGAGRKPLPASEKRQAMTFYFPPEIAEAARQKSKLTGITLTHVVREALREWASE